MEVPVHRKNKLREFRIQVYNTNVHMQTISSFFNKRIYLFLFYVHCLCKAAGSPGTGVTDSCELLRMESGSSGRAASAANCGAISPGPADHFLRTVTATLYSTVFGIT